MVVGQKRDRVAPVAVVAPANDGDAAAAEHQGGAARLHHAPGLGHVRAIARPQRPGQARDLRTLSADIVAKTNEPIRAHIKKSFTATAA